MRFSPDAQRLITAMPDLYIALTPNHPTYTILGVSNAYLAATMKEGESLVGKGLFEVFPPFDEDHKRANSIIRASLQKVIKTGKGDTIQLQKYDLRRPCGYLETRYWRISSTPVFKDGKLSFIAHSVNDLTLQFQTEERLQDARRRLNDTLAAGSVATWVWSIDERKIYGDKNYAKFFGIAQKDAEQGVMSDSFTNSVHPDDRARVRELVQRSLKKPGQHLEVEYRIVGVKIEPRWVLARGRVEWQEDQPVRFAGVLVDITGRKSAEEAARQSEMQLKFMADAMPQKVFIASAKGKADYFNPQWLEFTDLSFTRMKGDGWHSIVHPDDLPDLISRWTEAIAHGEAFEFEARFLAADGMYRWHTTRVRAFRTDEGKITRWIGSSTDITENKQHIINLDFLARASEVLGSYLEPTEALRRVAALAVPDMADWCLIDLYDPQDGFKQVAVTHKDPKKSVWAMEQRQLLPPTCGDTRGIGKVVATGQPEFYSYIDPAAVEAAIKNPAHKEIMQKLGLRALIIVPLKIDNKTIGAISLISAEQKRRFTEDDLETAEELAHRAGLAITNARLYRAAQDELYERNRLQQALHIANEKLEARVKERTEALERTNQSLARSNRELQDFAYIASHDLQEPLRKIQAFGNLLDEEYGKQLGEGKDYLLRMRNAASRMSTLIQDLLSFSRVTTMAQPFKKVALMDLIPEVLSDLETRLAETGGTVTYHDLPEVMADPMQMRQLFQNLIANALKFHRTDVLPQVKITSTLTQQKNGIIKACRIRVADNGIGFDEKYVDRIFAVFQRLHGRDAYEGTGIGLAVCRKIVERHGGTITATSTEGEGAVFTVTLPVYHKE